MKNTAKIFSAAVILIVAFFVSPARAATTPGLGPETDWVKMWKRTSDTALMARTNIMSGTNTTTGRIWIVTAIDGSGHWADTNNFGQSALNTKQQGSGALTNWSGLFFDGSGSPEGNVSARVGAVFTCTNGCNGSGYYVKTNGTGNTGWYQMQDSSSGGGGGISDGSKVDVQVSGSGSDWRVQGLSNSLVTFNAQGRMTNAQNIIRVETNQMGILSNIVAAATEGTIIELGAGTFNILGQSLVIPAGNITLRGQPGGQTVISGTNDLHSPGPGPIVILNTSNRVADLTIHLALSHLVFQAGIGFDYLVGNKAATNFLVERVRVVNGQTDGMYFSHSNYYSGVIRDCFVDSKWDAYVQTTPAAGALTNYVEILNTRIVADQMGVTQPDSINAEPHAVRVSNGTAVLHDCDLVARSVTNGLSVAAIVLGGVNGTFVHVVNGRITAQGTNAVYKFDNDSDPTTQRIYAYGNPLVAGDGSPGSVLSTFNADFASLKATNMIAVGSIAAGADFQAPNGTFQGLRAELTGDLTMLNLPEGFFLTVNSLLQVTNSRIAVSGINIVVPPGGQIAVPSVVTTNVTVGENGTIQMGADADIIFDNGFLEANDVRVLGNLSILGTVNTNLITWATTETTLADGDFLPMVDISAAEFNKITLSALRLYVTNGINFGSGGSGSASNAIAAVWTNGVAVAGSAATNLDLIASATISFLATNSPNGKVSAQPNVIDGSITSTKIANGTITPADVNGDILTNGYGSATLPLLSVTSGLNVDGGASFSGGSVSFTDAIDSASTNFLRSLSTATPEAGVDWVMIVDESTASMKKALWPSSSGGGASTTQTNSVFLSGGAATNRNFVKSATIDWLATNVNGNVSVQPFVLDSSITSAKITDATIATGDLANNSVDGTKIALGSDAAGDIMYYNGTDYVRLADPAGAGFFLGRAGSAAPSWARVAGSVPATAVNFTSVGGWVFTNGIDAISGGNGAFNATTLHVGLRLRDWGDFTITASGGEAVGTIDNDVVTFAKIQNLSASTLVGRGSAGGTGDPEAITAGNNMAIEGTTISYRMGVTNGGAVTNVTFSLTNAPHMMIWYPTNGQGSGWSVTFAGFPADGSPADDWWMVIRNTNTTVSSMVWPSSIDTRGSAPVLLVGPSTNVYQLVWNGTNMYCLSYQELITGTGHLVASNTPSLRLPNINGTGFGHPYVTVNTNSGTAYNVTSIVARSAGIIFSNDSTGILSVHVNRQGLYRNVYIDAAAMISNITAGATFSTEESAGAGGAGGVTANTNKMVDSYIFSATDTNSVQFKFAPPLEWDLGTIKIKLLTWSTNNVATTTNVWGVEAVAVKDGTVITNTAWGTQLTITNVVSSDGGAAHITPATPALTVGNSPSANGQLVWFRIRRLPGHVNDNDTGQQKLLGAWIQYKEKEAEVASW